MWEVRRSRGIPGGWERTKEDATGNRHPTVWAAGQSMQWGQGSRSFWFHQNFNLLFLAPHQPGTLWMCP